MYIKGVLYTGKRRNSLEWEPEIDQNSGGWKVGRAEVGLDGEFLNVMSKNFADGDGKISSILDSFPLLWANDLTN